MWLGVLAILAATVTFGARAHGNQTRLETYGATIAITAVVLLLLVRACGGLSPEAAADLRVIGRVLGTIVLFLVAVFLLLWAAVEAVDEVRHPKQTDADRARGVLLSESDDRCGYITTDGEGNHVWVKDGVQR